MEEYPIATESMNPSHPHHSFNSHVITIDGRERERERESLQIKVHKRKKSTFPFSNVFVSKCLNASTNAFITLYDNDPNQTISLLLKTHRLDLLGASQLTLIKLFVLPLEPNKEKLNQSHIASSLLSSVTLISSKPDNRHKWRACMQER